MLNKKTTQNNK